MHGALCRHLSLPRRFRLRAQSTECCITTKSLHLFGWLGKYVVGVKNRWAKKMLKSIARHLVSKAESRIGVKLDYAHQIADTDFGLMARYGKIFDFLDPNKKVPPLAYHTARLRGALAADCGTCVEAEINLAKASGIEPETIKALLKTEYEGLASEISAVARLADAVVKNREDDLDARAEIQSAFGTSGLIEICYAMNGAALLPGIKRGMGYATECNLKMLNGNI